MQPNFTPQRTLGLFDTSCIIVGVIIGSGIYITPIDIAGQLGSPSLILSMWIIGGLLSLIGALCFAELATTYPQERGEYHYLTRAYGPWAGFTFAWSRLMVIHTGNTAIMASIASSYAVSVFSLPVAQPVIAISIIVLFSVINALGIVQGSRTQNMLVGIQVLTLVCITGIMLCASPSPEHEHLSKPVSLDNIYLSMILILFTFGGWSDSAFVTPEIRNPAKTVLRGMLLGLCTVTTIYILLNLALLNTLGSAGIARSEAVVAEAMQVAVGPAGAVIVGLLVVVTALGSTNGMILTGGRLFSSFGTDYPIASFMKPRNAMCLGAFITQALISITLVLSGRFEDLVVYTTAAHWFFFMMNGAALMILRNKDPDRTRPYRVHGYPFTPMLFIASSGLLVYSSLVYAGYHSLIGFGVVFLGVFMYWVNRTRFGQGAE